MEQGSDTYGRFPSGMREYLEAYGFHFSKKPYEWAVSKMKVKDGTTGKGNKSLASTAKAANVTDHAKFQNAGYPGMYNMESWKLEKKRGVKEGKLFDGMSRTGLAANLFRAARTEELVKSRQISGQADSGQTHHTVGRQVRNIAGQNTGRKPERPPQEKELPMIKKALGMTAKEMKRITPIHPHQ